MIVLASFQAGFWYAAIAALTLILGAAYSLWMINRVVYGEVDNENVDALTDVTPRERLLLGTLAVVIIAVGVYPAPLVEVMEPSLDALFRIVVPTF